MFARVLSGNGIIFKKFRSGESCKQNSLKSTVLIQNRPRNFSNCLLNEAKPPKDFVPSNNIKVSARTSTAKPDIPIRIRARVVEIERKSTGIRAVIPITPT